MNPPGDIPVVDAVVKTEHLDAGREQAIAVAAPIAAEVVLSFETGRLQGHLVLDGKDRAIRSRKRRRILSENRARESRRAQEKKQREFVHSWFTARPEFPSQPRAGPPIVCRDLSPAARRCNKRSRSRRSSRAEPE